MEFILWIIAVVLVIAGFIRVFNRDVLVGVILIILGFLIGPGGISLLS